MLFPKSFVCPLWIPASNLWGLGVPVSPGLNPERELYSACFGSSSPKFTLLSWGGAKLQHTQARSSSRFVFQIKKILQILHKRGLKFRQFFEAAMLTLHCESWGAPMRFLSSVLGTTSAERGGRTTTGNNPLAHDRQFCDCLTTAFIMFSQHTWKQQVLL